MKKRFIFGVLLLFVFLFFNAFLVSSSLEVSKLEVSGVSNGDYFGRSVSIYGDYVIVGSDRDDTKGTDSGAVYAFKKDYLGKFNFVQKIFSNSVKKDGWFGSSVSIYDSYLLVGSPKNGNGLAEVFKKNILGNFNFIKKFTGISHDGSYYHPFGWSVSVFGNYFVIGEFWDFYYGLSCYSYIFEKDSSDNFEKVFVGKGGDYVSFANYFDFYPMVYAFGDYFAFTGKIGNTKEYYNVVRVYKKDSNGKIILLDTVIQGDVNSDFTFGYSIALSQNYLAVGYFDEDSKKSAVNLYKKGLGEKFGLSQTILVGSEYTLSGISANSIAISEEYLAIGNYEEENGKGAVYLYKKNSSGSFEFLEKILPNDRKVKDYFGFSLSIYEDDLIIGALGTETSKGSVYAVNLNPVPECSRNLLNTSKTSWINITDCLENNQQNQSRNWTEYNKNNCGTFENKTYFEYQNVSCIFCTQFLKNTTIPSEWNNISEVNGQMNQSRNWTEYDANNCGTFPNVTHFEYRLIPLNIVLSSPSCESFGGYCSPVSLENASLDENFLCTSTLDDCYFCNEGFSFDSSKNCVDSIEIEWVCERGLGFSYWEKVGKEDKLWIYSSSDSDLIGEEKCNTYGDSFCCPTSSVCESNGECSFEENFLEYCSSLTEKNSCEGAPDLYANDEIISLRENTFLATTCSNSWYKNSSNANCNLRSSCSCFWNSSLGKCLSREKIEDSCSNGEDSNSGYCTYEEIREENKCDSTGYYFREIVAVISGYYPDSENCVNVSQTIDCSTNALSLPFFGIVSFILVAILILFVYLFFYSKKFKKLFT